MLELLNEVKKAAILRVGTPRRGGVGEELKPAVYRRGERVMRSDQGREGLAMRRRRRRLKVDWVGTAEARCGGYSLFSMSRASPAAVPRWCGTFERALWRVNPSGRERRKKTRPRRSRVDIWLSDGATNKQRARRATKMRWRLVYSSGRQRVRDRHALPPPPLLLLLLLLLLPRTRDSPANDHQLPPII